MHSFTAIVATVLTAIIAVEAGNQHVPMGNHARHAAVIRRNPAPVAAPVTPPKWSNSRRGLSRRCKNPRPKPNPPSTPAPSNGGNSGNGGNNGGNSGNGGNNGGNSGNGGNNGDNSGNGGNNGGNSGNGGGNNGGNSGGGSSGGSGGGPSGGVINFSWQGACPPNPNPQPGNDSGPNGAEDFMNCGLNNGGWQPPNVKLSDLVYHPSLRDAVNEPGSPFTACASLVDAFESVGAETGVPAILLASFAMQESSCNPDVTGGAGEIGLMQLTGEKCPPAGNCYDAQTNLRIGANYFKTVLDSHGGNVFQAAGEYNGWYSGMQPGDVIHNPCAQQQNLDYLHHMFNFWMQNRDPNGAGNQRNKQACGGW